MCMYIDKKNGSLATLKSCNIIHLLLNTRLEQAWTCTHVIVYMYVYKTCIHIYTYGIDVFVLTSW